MWDAIRGFVGGAYAPHGYCLLWQPWLVWTMAVSDGLIALAYFSIPIALITFIRNRNDIAFGGVFWLFALFITACGLTHVASIWNLWNGDYQYEAIIKLITAGASVVTAVILWPLLPRAIALPSPARLMLRRPLTPSGAASISPPPPNSREMSTSRPSLIRVSLS